MKYTVICKSSNTKYLTESKIDDLSNNDSIDIFDTNNNYISVYPVSWFKSLTEFRSDRIKKILCIL